MKIVILMIENNLKRASWDLRSLRCWDSSGCHSTLPQAGWLITMEICSLTVLRLKVQSQGVGRGRAALPPESSKGGSLRPRPASGGPSSPGLGGASLQSLPPSCGLRASLCLHRDFSSLCLRPNFSVLKKKLVIGLGPSQTHCDLILA